VAMVYQLVGFHINLLSRGMTTYDFIVSEQKRQRDQLAAKRNQGLPQRNSSPSPSSLNRGGSTGNPGNNANDEDDDEDEDEEVDNENEALPKKKVNDVETGGDVELVTNHTPEPLL